MSKHDRKVIETGDYVVSKKLLVNVGDERREWLKRVAALAESPVADVIRVLIDQAANEDPAQFASKLERLKLKMKLEDIEKRERQLAEEKQKLVASLDNRTENGRAKQTV